MKLYHYSKGPFVDYFPSTQTPSYNGVGKPCGLWVSYDENDRGWADWCVAEGFRLDKLSFRTEIILRGDARVAIIKTADDLDTFVGKYPDSTAPDGLQHCGCVSWYDVSRDFQGIVILDAFIPARSLGGPLWYYAWDCDSGCIWDTTAIARVEKSLPFDVEAYQRDRENADAAE